MRNKIAIINFSAALIQEDCIQGKNKGSYYHSTQKGSLVSYLTSRFPKASIDFVGFSTNLKFRVRNYERHQVVQLPGLNNLGISLVLFNILSFLYLFKCKPSVIYAYTDGFSPPYLGVLCYAKLLKIPFFIDFRNLPRSLSIDASVPLYKKIIAKVADKICLGYSCKIVHISKRSRELLKQNPYFYHKSIVVPSCASNVFFEDRKIGDGRNKKLRFATWGVIGKTRNLGTVIRGFVKAKKLNNEFNADFLIIGDGEDLGMLKKLAHELGSPGITFKGYLNQRELHNVLQDGSVAVVPIPPEKIYHQYSSPLKLAEAIAMELPIIASNIEANQIVKEQDIGVLCDHNEDSYAQAFLEFWNFSDSKLNEYSENCRKIKHLFMPENVFRELGDIIAQFIEKQS